jgi:hypothetical protein
MNFWSLVLLSVLGIFSWIRSRRCSFADEQLTFWAMRAVVFHRLPKNYYTKTMKDIVRDSEVFKVFLIHLLFIHLFELFIDGIF